MQLRYNQQPTIGIISPPAWFDPTLSELPFVLNNQVSVQQSLRFLEHDQQTDTFESLLHHSRLLVDTGAEVIVQNGTFDACEGLTNEDQARRRAAMIEQSCGKPILFNALSMIDALRALDCNNPAIACTYHDHKWMQHWSDFMLSAGFELQGMANLADQGFAPDIETFNEAHPDMSDEWVVAAIKTLRDENPDADAIVLTGIRCRTLGLVEPLETLTECPIIAADTANYWAAAQALSIKPEAYLLGELGMVEMLY